MSQIRKRSLKAATWIYLGFFIGAVNTYLFTHKDWFSPTQYGLTRSMLEISLLVCAFSTLGVTNFLVKFFPYYSDNLDKKRNDILALALYVALGGFLVTATGLYFLRPLIVQKLGTNSPLLVEYFYYIIPLAFFVLLYNILEAYAYGFNKGVLTSLLKETVLRFYTSIIIVLKIFNIIDFYQFLVLFTLQYAVIVLILFFHLKSENKFWFSFKISRVSKKFSKKIITLLAFTFLVIIVNVLRQSIDTLVLAARLDLAKVGIFGISSYLVSIMQAPFRSLMAITIPILARAWKDKNRQEINRIYHRSSINLLTFSLFVFFCVWLNFNNAVLTLGMNPDYLLGRWVFFILGIVTIIEMGTGMNGQIIGTSVYWRFELWTSLLLTIMIVPLSYFLTVKYGIYGPALANLLSFSIYNFLRFWFLWRKFHMQPFNKKTVEILIIAAIAYTVSYFIFLHQTGWAALIGSSAVFAAIYLPLVYLRNISPDVKPIVNSVLKKFKG
ncbi:lipopolysaccharide biosynthesis protein [Ferruginibacter sp. HRS2-29]|uniref:lipopolysaccharide biosynthesis protein n=1 Tax=Ferruginibacter sp. HRS2-29 TaxID=2487334 RepID=UPI0020CCC3DA|nr:lipopolysaccharide biosynthesis protein [Ferruginibacter sp. HRS2-29]MCP9750923.1 lipopolysaccharide biosynthesis protein [Ferruginibacter sp. HRS2-29]